MEAYLKIKNYLDSKGISQAFVSRETGMPLPRLNLSLNGHRKLTIEEYESICWALDVDPGTFLEARPPKKAVSP